MQNYLDLVRKVYQEGFDRPDRTGTGTRTLLNQTLQFDLTKSFPLVTTKRTYWKGVVEELLWFLRGETNIKSLQEKGVHIWDEWAAPDGELGPVYGSQWRDFNHRDIDQIMESIFLLRTDPFSRRNIVSAWNPEVLPDTGRSPRVNALAGRQALPPCHTLFQLTVDNRNRLHLTLFQRSADLFLGVPFNIASYALLNHMMAKTAGLFPGTLTIHFTDCHLYMNHFEQVKELLKRAPSRFKPRVHVNIPEGKEIWDLTMDNIILDNYFPLGAIKAEVAV